MFAKPLIAFAALIGLAATPVLAQTTAPASPSRPAVTAPPARTTPAPATTPNAAKKTNLNTANATELDTLPDVGRARSKAILDERAKGPFKDWADFDKRMTGTSVNAGVKTRIKDLVTF